MSKSTMILVNPQAREGEVGRKWPDLERQLLGALGDGDARVEFTSAVDYGSATVRKAVREGVERILIVGGDGTISEAVQGLFDDGKLISRDVTLMVMPAGRGDDFFKAMVKRRCVSSTDAWEKGLDLLKHGKPERADLGTIEWIPAGEGRGSGGGSGSAGKRAFVNVASFGFPGMVVKRVHEHAGIWGRSKAGKSA